LYSNNHESHLRIDYFLISKDLVESVSDCSIGPIALNDHAAVQLCLVMEPDGVKKRLMLCPGSGVCHVIVAVSMLSPPGILCVCSAADSLYYLKGDLSCKMHFCTSFIHEYVSPVCQGTHQVSENTTLSPFLHTQISKNGAATELIQTDTDLKYL